jgi:hypothetical protein
MRWSFLSRLTAHISARTLSYQHAGATDFIEKRRSSPVADTLMPLGALQVFARRHVRDPGGLMYFS